VIHSQKKLKGAWANLLLSPKKLLLNIKEQTREIICKKVLISKTGFLSKTLLIEKFFLVFFIN